MRRARGSISNFIIINSAASGDSRVVGGGGWEKKRLVRYWGKAWMHNSQERKPKIPNGIREAWYACTPSSHIASPKSSLIWVDSRALQKFSSFFLGSHLFLWFSRALTIPRTARYYIRDPLKIPSDGGWRCGGKKNLLNLDTRSNNWRNCLEFPEHV